LPIAICGKLAGGHSQQQSDRPNRPSPASNKAKQEDQQTAREGNNKDEAVAK
jgi:hypothetical protein